MYKNGFLLKSLLCLFLLSFLVSCSGPKRHYKRSTSHVSKKRISKSKTRSKPAASSATLVRSSVVSTAKKYLGIPYTYGGKKPQSGFDCSGFISYVFKQNGYPLEGASHTQAKKGRKKSRSLAKPGDLVFFGKNKKISHVAIVTRNTGKRMEVIHSTSSRGVVIDNINESDYWQSRYLFTTEVIR